MTAPTAPVATATEALRVILDLVSDPLSEWSENHASRATFMASQALRDLERRPQFDAAGSELARLRADVEQLKRLGAELERLAAPITMDLTPTRLEYAEAEGLEAVNRMARQGWRVHQADPGSEWFLLEREALAEGETR